MVYFNFILKHPGIVVVVILW